MAAKTTKPARKIAAKPAPKSQTKMQKYANMSGKSGVSAFEIGPEFIRVLFTGGSRYRYNARTPGPIVVRRMKKLALAGSGLNSFISSKVRSNYAAREA